MPIPCVTGNTTGLSLFQATADQRYALGEDAFLRTHLPIRFWLQHAGAYAVWTEKKLLERLLDPSESVSGNRVFVLFGAAGSGKSEAMRWLMSMIGKLDQDRAQFCLRIARTELDPVRIVVRLLEAFQAPGLGEHVLHRWDDLRRKPVALANQMVWHALTGVFDSDEEILPLSYRLRPVVEANLRAGFTAMDEPEMAQRPLELISREQLEQVLGDTVLDLEPVFEHLRARLQAGFEQQVLGGIQLVPVLREISRRVRRDYGVRPLLFVDDLVQSMNVYASDLLDYVITLEEGEWDVVLGITPSAFEWDRRGRELLLRIRELDTVDDRVVKLDLSDTTGDISAFLDEESAVGYLAPYLGMFKQAAGFACNSGCPHWHQCGAMQWGLEDGAQLSPFNPAFIRRLWRHLPSGKGRARYLLLAVRTALEAMVVKGASGITELPSLIERDLYVTHTDERVRTLLECYHPGGEASEVALPTEMADIWGLESGHPSKVQELGQGVHTPGKQASEPRPHDGGRDNDAILVAVRDWLEGGLPNPELLKRLRAGIARFLRDGVDPALLVGVGFAQVNGALRWSAQQDGVNLPIRLEGIDTGEGIPVPREIGANAFDLLAYGESKGPARTALSARLLGSGPVCRLFYRAESQREIWRLQVESALGMPITEWAFHLFRTGVVLGATLDPTLTLVGESTPPLPGAEWPPDLVKVIHSLWEDCFRIREHLFDGHRLMQYTTRWPQVSESVAIVERGLRKNLPDSFRLCDRKFGDVEASIRGQIRRVANRVAEDQKFWPDRLGVVETAMHLTDGRSRAALHRRWLTLVEKAHGHLVIPAIPPTPIKEVAVEITLLAQVVTIKSSGDDFVEAYRASAAWAQAEKSVWLIGVRQWRDDLRSIFHQTAAFLARMGHEAAVVDHQAGGLHLLEQSAKFLEVGQTLQDRGDRIQQVKAMMDSPLVQQCRVMNSLLIALLPDGYAIKSWLLPVREQAMQAQETWSAADHWLLNGDQASLPVLVQPDANQVTALQHSIRKASSWWVAYLDQLPLLQVRGRTPDLTAARRFLADTLSLSAPSQEGIVAWSRFVAYARRRGTPNLPVLSLQDRVDLPIQVRTWFAALSAAGPQGLSLHDLTPKMLSELQGCMPEWVRTIRLSLVPEGGNHGVLHLMDGQ